MKITFAASECVPFSKTGGLADVVGALPQALAALGHEVTVFLPKYKQTKLAAAKTVLPSLTIPFVTAVRGGETTIELERDHRRESLVVKIPPGIESGAIICAKCIPCSRGPKTSARRAAFIRKLRRGTAFINTPGSGLETGG